MVSLTCKSVWLMSFKNFVIRAIKIYIFKNENLTYFLVELFVLNINLLRKDQFKRDKGRVLKDQ